MTRPLLLLLAARPLAAQAPDTAAMARAQHLLPAACAEERAATWGVAVCGPLLLATWTGRTVVASERDAAGTFTPVGRWWIGTLGAGQFPSNSAIELGGTRWSMVVLPLPEDDALATTLLGHEQFHRIQRDLGLPYTDPGNAHLDSERERTLLRLEWRALAAAIAASGDASCAHSRDALALRAARHAAHPGAARSEALLERHEGMAEYTGQRLAAARFAGGDQRLRDHLRQAEAWPSYVRSFAYASGAAYGALLDRGDPVWRTRIRQDSAGPAELLAATLRCPDTEQALSARADRYGGQVVASEERHRSDSLTTRRQDYRARLVEGPVLRSPDGALRFTFDPNAVFPLGEHGNVYPSGTFSGAWGSLEVVRGGALVSADFRTVQVPLGGRERGDWTLTLSDGWRVGENGQVVGP